MDELGHYYYDRADLQVEKASELVKKMAKDPPNEFGGTTISKIENLDGLKLSFADESWILFRASGTEPLLRIYAEGRSFDQVELLLSDGQKLVQTSD
jgi:phosphomannomutase